MIQIEPGSKGFTALALAAERSRPYAVALVAAARGQGDVQVVVDELGEIVGDVLERFPRFAEILGSSEISITEKDRILVDAFQGKASDLVMRFLRVLNRHGRLELLAGVARESKILWDRECRRVPVSVRSASPLSDEQVARLRDRLLQTTGLEPMLQISIHPELLGGLVIQLGDQRYDASLKNRLETLRQRLIQGKTHEIQSRRDQFSHSE